MQSKFKILYTYFCCIFHYSLILSIKYEVKFRDFFCSTEPCWEPGRVWKTDKVCGGKHPRTHRLPGLRLWICHQVDHQIFSFFALEIFITRSGFHRPFFHYFGGSHIHNGFIETHFHQILTMCWIKPFKVQLKTSKTYPLKNYFIKF